MLLLGLRAMELQFFGEFLLQSIAMDPIL